jgi:glycosyltransferase involved in cell wall biosynthesis
MKKNKTLIYWTPFIDSVATIKATYNSVQSLNRYSKSFLNCKIIDVYGEWQSLKYLSLNRELFYSLKDIKILNKFSSKGFFKSRLKYLIIFFLCFFPLKNFLYKKKPDFLVIHLLTSLPLILNLIFKFKTKIILRISGKPKLNFFRNFFWKICLKKIYRVTCPTDETLQYLKQKKIVDNKKLFLLYDPIIDIKDFCLKKNENFKTEYVQKDKYYLAIGRLTKQKNFDFLINCFSKIVEKDRNIKLIILGEGENYRNLKLLIYSLNLENNIILAGYEKNVYKFLLNSKAFILSSLWEDPGFVLIEAMLSNTLVFSSDCSSGPKEIVGNDRGILFNNNSKEDFINKFKLIQSITTDEKNRKLLNAKKFIKKFTLLNHYKNFNKIIYD